MIEYSGEKKTLSEIRRWYMVILFNIWISSFIKDATRIIRWYGGRYVKIIQVNKMKVLKVQYNG